jgi:HlyD family secretion protein
MAAQETFDSTGAKPREHHHGAAAGPLSDRVRSLRLPPESVSSGAWTRLAWLLCGVLAVATGVLGYMVATGTTPARDDGATAPAQGADADATTSAAPAVSTGAAGPVLASGKIALEAKGFVTPVHQVLVSPQVSGRIVVLEILEGKRVKEGDVLAKLDDAEYKADYLRALAMLEGAKQRLKELGNYRPEEISQAEAELEETKAQVEQLKAAFDRAKKLRELEPRALSDDAFEEQRSRFLAMQRRKDRLENAFTLMKQGPRLEKKLAAEADVKQAEAEVDRTKWRLDRCIITAPISGTILKKNAERGNVVNPIAMNGSFSLCDLADLGELEIEVMVFEREVSKISMGQKCQVRPEAFPKRNYDGVVSRLMPVADRGKGAIPVRVLVTVPREEEGVYLKPDMGALVAFLNPAQDEPPLSTSPVGHGQSSQSLLKKGQNGTRPKLP